MGVFLNTILVLAVKQGVPLAFKMGGNMIQSSIQLDQERLNQEAIEENIKTLSKIDKAILKQDKLKIPGLDVDKDELGRQTWKKMRKNIMALPEDASSETIKIVMAQNYEMIDQYPCTDCREHGLKFANEINFTNAETRKEAMIKTWELQNKVNEKLEKSIFPFESFKNQYGL